MSGVDGLRPGSRGLGAGARSASTDAGDGQAHDGVSWRSGSSTRSSRRCGTSGRTSRRTEALTNRRILGALGAAAVLMLALVSPAEAGDWNAPFSGDVDGDGLGDVVTLGASGGSTCSVRIAHGLTGGGHGTATTYTYPNPTNYPLCGDMGEVVDLGGDGTNEIVITDYDTFNPADAFFVLRQTGPTAVTFISKQYGNTMPNRVWQTDFNGDGRRDLCTYTDQGGGVDYYLNTASGGLSWLHPAPGGC